MENTIKPMHFTVYVVGDDDEVTMSEGDLFPLHISEAAAFFLTLIAGGCACIDVYITDDSDTGIQLGGKTTYDQVADAVKRLGYHFRYAEDGTDTWCLPAPDAPIN